MVANATLEVLINCLLRLAIFYSVLSGETTEAGSTVRKQFTGLRRSGFTLLPGYVNKQVDGVERIACTSECVRLTNCKTVSWNADQRTCLLSYTDVTHDNNAYGALVEDPAWTTMSMMEYTVFGAKPLVMTSTISFTEARDLCIERGTVIASRTDLWYSWGLGFNYYRCCWLSDGTVGFAIQSRSSISTCSTNSNPWALCILN